MNCPSCGNRLKPTDKYCTYCGHQISDNQKKRKKRILLVAVLSILALIVAVPALFYLWYVNKFRQSATVELRLPDIKEGDKTEEGDRTVEDGGVITFIIDGTVTKNQEGDDVSRSKDGIIFYYEGQPDLNTTELKEIKLDSIRQMLAQRNSELLTEINKIKSEWKNGNIDDEQYNNLVKKARYAQAADPNAHRVIVSIKPTSTASYADVVRMLDEMQINYIGTWQVETLSKEDSVLYERTTGHPIRAK